MAGRSAPQMIGGVRSGALLVVALMIGVACSGGGGGSDDGGSDALAGTPLARFLPDGPVHGVVMAAGVDEAGSPLQPTATFDPAAPEVTAIVALGAVGDDATVTVEWRRMGAGIGESDRLFAHRIAVEPLQRAYSVGVSEGVLAAGLYEVTASLGDHAMSALWRVADAERSPGSASPAGDNQAQPPAAGESGAIDRHASPASSTEVSGDCDGLRIEGHDEYRWVVEYDYRANNSMLARVDCPPAVASAAVVGSAVDIAEHPPSYSNIIHPCLLPGGSDMPGTVVHLSVRYADDKAELSGDQVELLDREDPFIVFVSEPENGSRVEAGDTVTLEALALRLPAAKGLRWAELRAPGEVLARDEREATPCDPKRFFIVLKATYTVPEDPPPVIELTAVAEDHDGLEATETITLVTGETWTGALRSQATQSGEGFQCVSAWEGAVDFTVDREGTVSGSGRVDLVGTPECSFGYRGNPITFYDFAIHGRRDDGRFILEFELSDYNPGDDAGGWITGHFVPLQQGTPEGQEFVVPITRPGVVDEQVSLRWNIPGSGGEVIDTFELTCETCQQASD